MNHPLTDRPLTGDAPAAAGAVPASPAQELAWAHEERHPGPAGHIQPLALALEGPLEPGILGAALNDVVARHAVLRTHFQFDRDRMFQVVAPALLVPLPVVDLRLLPADVREVHAFRLAQDEANRRFDLQRLPLLRAQLHLVEAGRHILVLAFHRAVMDESSLGLFLAELAACYDARRRGSTAALPPALPFGEHAARARRPSPQQEADLAWWRARLAGEPASPEVPADAARVGSSRAGRRRVEKLDLPGTARDRLVAFAHREGVDPLVVHLAAFATLLVRYGNRPDIVVGLRAADRSHAAAERTLGPLTRVLPWRADLAGDPTFRLLLDRVRADVREALAHAGAPLELAAATLPEGDPRTCPVQFSFQPDVLGAIGWPGVKLTLLEIETGLPTCALGLTVIERQPGLTLRAEFNGERHSAPLVQRLLGHYGVLLAAALERPETRLSELPLLTDAERRRLTEWNRTTAAFHRDATAAELVGARAAAAPDAPAVVADEGSLSYAELERRSNQLARLLRAAGMRPATVVGVLLESTPDLPVCQLALLKAGGTGLWLDPHRPRVELERVLAAARPAVVLTHARWAALAPAGADVRAVDEMADRIAAQDAAPLAPLAAPDDAAWLAESSGTTGASRLAALSHRALVCRLHALRHAPGVRPEDAVLVTGAVPGSPAAVQLLLPLAAGARLVLAPGADLASRPRLELLLARHAITLLFGSPAAWERLLGTGWTGMPGLRLVSTGQPLAPALAERLRLCGRELWNVYGAAETAGGCLALRIPARGATTALGRPLPNVHAHVLDGAMQPVPIGLAGELYLGGEALATHHVGADEATSEAFVPDPFHRVPGARLFRTGDIVRRLASGELEFVARRASAAPAPAEPAVAPAPAPRPAPARPFPFLPGLSPLPAP
ncbi:MAG TPA: condensation domain-containing protein [Opitutaceae bacterium]|nr:condensation domain-containing protein [Opitutaceae bacterium]